MDLNLVLAEVSTLRDHLVHDCDKYVHRWSSQQCKDYQLPILRLLGLLSSGGTKTIRMRNDPESMALRDIIENSALQQCLEFDECSEVFRLRDEVPPNERKVISAYLDSRASPIAD